MHATGPATLGPRAGITRHALRLVLLLLPCFVAAAAPAAAANPAAAPAEPVKEPSGAPLQMVSIYRFLEGVGEPDVIRALEGFMGLTKSIKAAALLTAGADLRLLAEPTAAANFSMTLALPDHDALDAYYRAPQRLNNTDTNIRPITAERVSMTYESDRIRLVAPQVGAIRYACIYTFHPEVVQWEQGRLEYELEDMMAAAPGVAHFSSGIEMWAEEVEDTEGIKNGRLGLVADFADAASLREFAGSPGRRLYLDRLTPYLEDAACVAFRVPGTPAAVAKDPQADMPPGEGQPSVLDSIAPAASVHVGPGKRPTAFKVLRREKEEQGEQGEEREGLGRRLRGVGDKA